ncbi:MAG: hypothetical protein IPF82_01365 [Blastocatellia bacterium]|nr:hypothetical protein [Blastocatellia bacterium]
MNRKAQVAALAVAAVGLAVAALASVRSDLATPVDVSASSYVQSETCQRCHEENYASWRRTFHRTMTQDASPDAVVGDFANRTFTFEGITSRMTSSGDVFFMETIGPDGTRGNFRIVRTVGSRRIQQYVTKIGDRHWRLPIAWSIVDGSWFHLNGGFLHPDGSDFGSHTSVWDANCIFCHNTKAMPGYDFDRQTFASSVEQLGIGCESCHGPGSEHIDRNTNPLRRYALHVSEHSDPTIVNPAKLDKVAQVQVCGHCHGQRMPNPTSRIREFLGVGDPYTAGSDLMAVTSPMWRDSILEGVDLTARFWRDGTPRLTAYEYQSLLMTADYQKGGLTCISCHSMHGGDPKGMITEEKRGPAACLTCHAEIGNDVAGHTKHLPDSTGSDCYACHMPKIVFGVMQAHPTHRIAKPDPSRAWTYQMPEACTVCHVNRTAVWAALELSRQLGTEAPPLPEDPQFATAETVRAAFAGDVVQRAIAAEALGAERGYTPDPVARLWSVPILLIVMEDSYPAIRTSANRSLRALVGRAGLARADVGGVLGALPRFEPQADPDSRRAVLARWWQWWAGLEKRGIDAPDSALPLDGRFLPQMDRIQQLRARQDNSVVSIGE